VTEPIVVADDLIKVYGEGLTETKALDSVSFSINAGEFVVLLGPSGSGKTTLLNQIGALEPSTSGSLRVHGTEIAGMSDKERTEYRRSTVGFVFQFYNLVATLTAHENVALIAEITGDEPDARSDVVLDKVGLSDRREYFPGQLSGGQQQRVAVARALASKPKFVLADEPTANLDSKSTETLLDIMEQLNKEEGITFIFSTHDARVVKKARRVITVEDGKVISDEKKN
jgi:putative ABC transport system ATP-binding protein